MRHTVQHQEYLDHCSHRNLVLQKAVNDPAAIQWFLEDGVQPMWNSHW